MFQIRRVLGVTIGLAMGISKEEKLRTRLLLKNGWRFGDQPGLCGLSKEEKLRTRLLLKSSAATQLIQPGNGEGLSRLAPPMTGTEPALQWTRSR